MGKGREENQSGDGLDVAFKSQLQIQCVYTSMWLIIATFNWEDNVGLQGEGKGRQKGVPCC